MRFLSPFLVVPLLASLASCASHRDDRFQTRRGSFWDRVFGGSSYEEVFDRNTKEERIHSEFEPVMSAFITYWNADLREAYIEEMRRQFRLSDENIKKIALEQNEEEQKFFVFILTVSTREPSWTDFNKKTSMWRITLENQDSSIQADPERVEPISQKDETAKSVYRRMSSFSQTYKVRFPKTAIQDVSSFYFHITGMRGSLLAEFKTPLIKRSVDLKKDDS
jgi:hypothetical protein